MFTDYSLLTIYHSQLCTVGEAIALTYLDNIMYVVCRQSSTIRLYNTDTYSPLDTVINVEGMKWPRDVVICPLDRQLYVADEGYCIWRVSADDHSYVKWLPTISTPDTFYVWRLSLTSRRLIVTSSQSPTLHQYSTVNGQPLCVIQLPQYVEDLYHAVETTRETFVVCHRGTSQDKQQYVVSELVFVTVVNGYTVSMRVVQHIPELLDFSQ